MFLLGKLLLLLLRPLTWILILFAWGLLTKKPLYKKRLLPGAFFLFLFFTNPFVLRLCIRAYETRPVVLTRSYDAGIVLGGFVSYNSAKKHAFFNPASDRFIQTARLYKKGQIRHIIVAAGNGYVTQHAFQEAAFIRDRLVEIGIPDSAISIDPYSRNTLENARNASHIFDSLHWQPPAVLITSALHMPRARALFQKQGLLVQPFPADFRADRVANNVWEDYFIPSAQVLDDWNSLLKEWSGMLLYSITGKI